MFVFVVELIIGRICSYVENGKYDQGVGKEDTLVEKAEGRAIEAEKLARQLSEVMWFNVEMATQPQPSELAPAVSQVHSNNHLMLHPLRSSASRFPSAPYRNPADDDIYMGDSESVDTEGGRKRKAVKRRNRQREENRECGSDKGQNGEEGLT